MNSTPVTLNTVPSLGPRAPRARPVSDKMPAWCRSPVPLDAACPSPSATEAHGQRSREHAGLLQAGPAPRGDRAGERRVAHRPTACPCSTTTASCAPACAAGPSPLAPCPAARSHPQSRRTARACGDDYDLSLDLKDADAAADGDRRRCGRGAGAAAPPVAVPPGLAAAVAAMRPLDAGRAAGGLDPARAASRRGPSGAPPTCGRPASTPSTCTTATGRGGLIGAVPPLRPLRPGVGPAVRARALSVLRMGIDGVFSDRVDRMIDAFRAEGLEPG